MKTTMFNAFTEELLAIKVAEERESMTSRETIHFLKNMAKASIAYGLGAGTSKALQRWAAPMLARKLSPEAFAKVYRYAIPAASLATAAGSLAWMQMMAKNKELAREQAKRNK